jgi:plasmid stabilization system protein ParE
MSAANAPTAAGSPARDTRAVSFTSAVSAVPESGRTDASPYGLRSLRTRLYRVRFHQDNDTMRILRVRNRREAYR